MNKNSGIQYPVTTWIQNIDQFESTEDFIKIAKFFLINTPVEGLSARGIILQNYGWEEGFNIRNLNNKLKKSFHTSDVIYKSGNLKDLNSLFQKLNFVEGYSQSFKEEKVVFANTKGNQFMGICTHIRNCFAHSRFNIHELEDNDWIFYFEDVSSRANTNNGEHRLSAKMYIRKSTLLKWIDIIQQGPEK